MGHNENKQKQDGKAVIMAEAACMATLAGLMVTSDQATNFQCQQYNSITS